MLDEAKVATYMQLMFAKDRAVEQGDAEQAEALDHVAQALWVELTKDERMKAWEIFADAMK